MSIEMEAGLSREFPACGRICDVHMHEAQVLQNLLLPSGPLERPSAEISFRFLPHSEVSGDFADFFTLPNGLVGMYLGDVVGKGLPAAMYGALVMGTLRGIHKSGVDPSAVLALLNDRLLQRPLPGRFCCTLYALFNPSTGKLTFSNAGLPFPVLFSRNGYQPLGGGGFPSGMFPRVTYDQHAIQLSRGDTVIFATDGLHEASNGDGIELCPPQLAEIWAQCRDKSADQSLSVLLESLQAFCGSSSPQDDITVVALKAG